LKNKTLFLALFFCEAIPTFIVSSYIYADYTTAFLPVFLVAISLVFSWFFADKNKELIRNAGYVGMLIGIAFSVSYFTSYESSKGILLAALSMIIGVNVSLRERRMLAYLLIFSFILFLYANSIVLNKYSIVSIVLFTFAFFTVVIVDNYSSKLHLQSHYKGTGSKNFFGTVVLLVITVGVFTAVLYYFMPQPEAKHFGLLPFGGKKQYVGIADEGNVKSKNYKERTTKLPTYTIDGRETKRAGNLLKFQEKTNSTVKTEQNNIEVEQALKRENKKAYYSSLPRKEDKGLSAILFEVKGKEARFLRGNTYASFNGRTWKKILTKMYTIKKGSRDSYSYWNGKEWKRRTKLFTSNDFYYNEYLTKKTDNYTITVKGKLAGKPIIYTPAGLLRLQFPTDTFYEDAGRTIYAPEQLEVGTYYSASVESEKYYGYDAMSYAAVWYKKAYSRPGYHPDARMLELAKKLTKSWDNSFEKAQAIVHYFKTNYLYKHASIQDPIQNQTLPEMLFKTKVGNALQFNTALIMMLRASGEYARLVTGYAPSAYNQVTHSYIVERKNRAVWSEVFVKGRGWVAIHAADDIPFAGEQIEIELKKVFLTKTELIFLSIVALLLLMIAVYYSRPYIWTYLARYRIRKYAKKSDIDFVIAAYKEVEQYYRHFQKGQKSSCTLQEYANYIKELKPQNSYLIEYLSFYANQAIYKKELDFEFDKERYLDASLYLIDAPFKVEPFYSYVTRKILKK